MEQNHSYSSILVVILFFCACNKTDFLNEKPQKSLVIPNSLAHYQAILDREQIMNGISGGTLSGTPIMGEIRSDNVHLPDAQFNNLQEQHQNYYRWAEHPYVGNPIVYDWEYQYRGILHTNAVLDGLANFTRTQENREEWDFIHAQALFHRAHLYYLLAQVFAPPYEIGGQNNASSIPLRLSADINEPLRRSTVQETYDLIISDLRSGISSLPTDNTFQHRPSKQAAYALLARIHLTTRDYAQAKIYADSSLYIQHELYDYNFADTTRTSSFSRIGTLTHPVRREVILDAQAYGMSGGGLSTALFWTVDTTLYASYHHDDLRKPLFFRTRPVGHSFKGSYHHGGYFFSGLAVDEVWLIRAEANIRIGRVAEGLDDLNHLLLHRWKAGTFVPYTGLDADSALALTLEHRRKQLIYRMLRSSDLRRLNQEGANITLTRHINGQNYTLPPNDSRWVMPFPQEVLVP